MVVQGSNEVSRVMQTKFPSPAIVLGVVSSGAYVISPFFFQTDFRVNTTGYVKVLEDMVKPGMDKAADGRPYVFQQDSAAAHNSQVTQN